jgi:NADH:ubiquinone oxidoreductase subunit 6 (subunit J)
VLPVVACVLAICVVVFANPMHALLSLVGVFLFTVLFYVSSGIEFIGLVFLIVYVGAVAILFLFVIMLLNVKSLTTNEPLLNHATQTTALVFGGLLAYHLFITVADRVGRATLRARSHVDLQFTGIDDAVYYQVMYRSADVNAIAPLYTEHAPLF